MPSKRPNRRTIDRPLSSRELRAMIAASASPPPDRHLLYEICAQSPAPIAALLRAIRGRGARVLAEDFCGSAAVARAWAEQPRSRAIATDIDPDLIRRLAARPDALRVRGVVADLRRGAPRDHADVIYVGNYSIGEFHDRRELMRYLRRARTRLASRGVFICDLYGGDSAFELGSVHRIHALPDGRRVRYTWQQRASDPLTGLVENAMHFRIDRGGRIEHEIKDAFVYRWRLWSIPELRDAMGDAGFADVRVYPTHADAKDQHGRLYVRPIADPSELDEDWAVLLAARN